MNLKKAWLAIPVGAALALSACSGGTNANAVVMNGSEPQNPLLPGMTSENGGGKILSAMFSQLVRYDVDGTPVLDVAESIEPNEDNTLWTVKLHQDRKFSDGTPVKAENFTRAWKLITSQNQTQASFFDSFEGTDEEGAGDLSGVEDVDDYTFTIKLKQPSYDLVSRLGYTAYAPLPDSTLDNPEAGGQKPVGNGPYKLASDTAWEHNVKVTLVPNENYWGEDKPKIDALIYKAFTGDDAEFNSVRSGSIDFGYIPAAQYNQRKAIEDKGYNVFLWPGNSITYLALNFHEKAPGSKFINQKYIRQAMQQLIDQPTLSQKIWSGTASPTCGPVPMAADKVGTTEGSSTWVGR